MKHVTKNPNRTASNGDTVQAEPAPYLDAAFVEHRTQASQNEARAYHTRRRDGVQAAQPPVTKKCIRVPAVRFGSVEVSLPTLRIAAMSIAAVFCISHNGRLLYWALAVVGLLLFTAMSKSAYRDKIFLQRAICAVLSFSLFLLGRSEAAGTPSASRTATAWWSTQTIVPVTKPPESAAPEPEASAAPAPSPTVAPTLTTQPFVKPKRLSHDGIDLDMILYYNENGGSYYHTSEYCPAVDSKYLPLTGSLIYEDLSTGKYKLLQRCTTCGAPTRPHTH